MDRNAATVATDYTKKPHVFRVMDHFGSEFLFQADSDAEMNAWVERLNSVGTRSGKHVGREMQPRPCL